MINTHPEARDDEFAGREPVKVVDVVDDLFAQWRQQAEQVQR